MVAWCRYQHRPLFIAILFSVLYFTFLLMENLRESYQGNVFNGRRQHGNGSLPESNNNCSNGWNSTADCGKAAGRQRAKVIIYTRFRSGSSFVGDIFSHHPDVYYVFEPLQLYTHAKNTEQRIRRITSHGAAFLNQTLHCDVEPLLKDVERFHKEGHRRIGYLGPTTFCRDYTRMVYAKDCNPYKPETIVQRCHRHRHVVIKTIVQRNLTSLKGLLEDGVKVIHLVRDPRGQILSITSLTKEPISQSVKFMCPLLRQDLQDSDALFKGKSAFQENYLMVRYEDVAGSPETMQQKLFSFTGITDHKYVHRWLNISTNTSRYRHPMSTRRVSRLTGEAWRRKMILQDLTLIQNECGDIIDKLGYRKLVSENDLRATELSVVDLMPSNHHPPSLV